MEVNIVVASVVFVVSDRVVVAASVVDDCAIVEDGVEVVVEVNIVVASEAVVVSDRVVVAASVVDDGAIVEDGGGGRCGSHSCCSISSCCGVRQSCGYCISLLMLVL